MLKSRNYLDWMNDLGARLNLKDISTQFISVAVAMNALVDSICEMANKEVSETPLSTPSFALGYWKFRFSSQFRFVVPQRKTHYSEATQS